MNCSMPGFPVLHHLQEFAQTRVHWVSNAISPSVIPFSSCFQSFPASGSFLMSQLFASGGQVLELQLIWRKEITQGFFVADDGLVSASPSSPPPPVPKVVLNQLLLPAKRSGQLLLTLNFSQTLSRVILLLYIPLSTPLKPLWNNLIT